MPNAADEDVAELSMGSEDEEECRVILAFNPDTAEVVRCLFTGCAVECASVLCGDTYRGGPGGSIKSRCVAAVIVRFSM